MKNLLFIAAAIFLLPFIGMKGSPAGSPSASKPSSRAGNAAVGIAYAPHYISPTPGRFPIIACSPISEGQIPTKADFDTVAACGFNAAMTVFNTAHYFPLMKEIEDLGIVLIPILDYYTVTKAKDTIEYIRQYMSDNDIPYSMIGGYRVRDEPSYTEIYDGRIGERHNAIKNADPDVMPFVNLAAQPINDFSPNSLQKAYSSNPVLRVDMSKYFKECYYKVHPDVWSYDFYPFVYRSWKKKLFVEYEDFYYNLRLFAGMSRRTGMPFWAYCQATNIQNITIGETDNIYTEHPKAKEEYLRYEAFNALALGAKAITYWRYSYRDDAPHPDTVGTNYDHYISSLTDQNGRTTPEWKAVQKVNEEIRRHEKLFMNSRLQSYSLIGNPALLLDTGNYVKPTDSLCADIPEYDGPVKVQVTSGPGVLVSKLQDGIRLVTFIVNQSPYDTTNVMLSYRRGDIRKVMLEREHADSLGDTYSLGKLSEDDDEIRLIGSDVEKVTDLKTGADENLKYDPTNPADRIRYREYRIKPAGYLIFEYEYVPGGELYNDDQPDEPDMVAVRARESLATKETNNEYQL